jgi:hypothetical protein
MLGGGPSGLLGFIFIVGGGGPSGLLGVIFIVGGGGPSGLLGVIFIVGGGGPSGLLGVIFIVGGGGPSGLLGENAFVLTLSCSFVFSIEVILLYNKNIFLYYCSFFFKFKNIE